MERLVAALAELVAGRTEAWVLPQYSGMGDTLIYKGGGPPFPAALIAVVVVADGSLPRERNMAELKNLTSVLENMDNQAEGDRLTLGEILDSFGSRGYGPLLLSAILIELMPTGGIPGIPTLVATTVIIFAAQMVAGRPAPWMPKKLRSKGLDRTKFNKAREKITPVTQKIDRLLKPRLHFLTTPVAAKAVGVVCILIALTMPPLEFVPFTGYFPAFPIALLALGLTGQDGLFILLGIGVAIVGAIAAAVALL